MCTTFFSHAPTETISHTPVISACYFFTGVNLTEYWFFDYFFITQTDPHFERKLLALFQLHKVIEKRSLTTLGYQLSCTFINPDHSRQANERLLCNRACGICQFLLFLVQLFASSDSGKVPGPPRCLLPLTSPSLCAQLIKARALPRGRGSQSLQQTQAVPGNVRLQRRGVLLQHITKEFNHRTTRTRSQLVHSPQMQIQIYNQTVLWFNWKLSSGKTGHFPLYWKGDQGSSESQWNAYNEGILQLLHVCAIYPFCTTSI